MDAHQNEPVGVSSNYSVVWITHYMHHNCMAAHQYVCADVSSDHCDKWMIYYTQHRKMVVPEYVSAWCYSYYYGSSMIH